MPGQLLIEYLDRRNAEYSRQLHSVAYTAPEIAEQSHINGGSFAKVVMVKINSELAMVVIPAHYYVDIEALKDELAAEKIVLANEREFSYRFPRCEVGAMPPFGHLYGLQTFMASVFSECNEIAFNAGTHSEVILMPLGEYLRLAYATVVTSGVIPPHTQKMQPYSIEPVNKIALSY